MLACVEQLTPKLSEETIQTRVFPLCVPYVHSILNVRHVDLYPARLSDIYGTRAAGRLMSQRILLCLPSLPPTRRELVVTRTSRTEPVRIQHLPRCSYRCTPSVLSRYVSFPPQSRARASAPCPSPVVLTMLPLSVRIQLTDV